MRGYGQWLNTLLKEATSKMSGGNRMGEKELKLVSFQFNVRIAQGRRGN